MEFERRYTLTGPPGVTFARIARFPRSLLVMTRAQGETFTLRLADRRHPFQPVLNCRVWAYEGGSVVDVRLGRDRSALSLLLAWLLMSALFIPWIWLVRALGASDPAATRTLIASGAALASSILLLALYRLARRRGRTDADVLMVLAELAIDPTPVELPARRRAR